MNLYFGALLFGVYVVVSCSGLYLIKAAPSWLTPAFVFGGFLYGCGAITWLFILRIFPLSIAFPIASGALMVGTSLVGFFLLRESISWQHMLGIAFIMLGISLLAFKVNIT